MIAARLAIAACMLACTACTQFAHPIVAESGPTLDSALVGRWEAEEDGKRVIVDIARDGAAGKVTTTELTAGKDAQVEEYTVKEMREFVQGYGTLIFVAQSFELRRTK